MNKKWILSIAIVLINTVNALAGDWTLTTNPTYETDTKAKINFVTTSKYDASNTGVGFTLSTTTTHGSITDWSWTFQNGTPPSCTTQNVPSNVTFGTAAYGLTNQCTVTFTHNGSGSGQFCSLVKNPSVNVNVIKPVLAFNVSGSWAGDDSAHLAANTEFSTTFNIAQTAQITINSLLYEVCPYEYKCTMQPDNSDVKTSDMNIWETNPSAATSYYLSTNWSTPASTPTASTNGSSFYVGVGNVNFTTVTFPANPVLYAFDSPGEPILARQHSMSIGGYNKYVGTITLTSYPIYKDPTPSHLDSAAVVSHTFTYTCISTNTNGSGTYNWTASP